MKKLTADEWMDAKCMSEKINEIIDAMSQFEELKKNLYSVFQTKHAQQGKNMNTYKIQYEVTDDNSWGTVVSTEIEASDFIDAVKRFEKEHKCIWSERHDILSIEKAKRKAPVSSCCGAELEAVYPKEDGGLGHQICGKCKSKI